MVPMTYLSSLPSEPPHLLSSKTDDSGPCCFLRFPSAPRFLPWDQRGGGCGLEADKPRGEHTRPLHPPSLKHHRGQTPQFTCLYFHKHQRLRPAGLPH